MLNQHCWCEFEEGIYKELVSFEEKTSGAKIQTKLNKKIWKNQDQGQQDTSKKRQTVNSCV